MVFLVQFPAANSSLCKADFFAASGAQKSSDKYVFVTEISTYTCHCTSLLCYRPE